MKRPIYTLPEVAEELDASIDWVRSLIFEEQTLRASLWLPALGESPVNLGNIDYNTPISYKPAGLWKAHIVTVALRSAPARWVYLDLFEAEPQPVEVAQELLWVGQPRPVLPSESDSARYPSTVWAGAGLFTFDSAPERVKFLGGDFEHLAAQLCVDPGAPLFVTHRELERFRSNTAIAARKALPKSQQYADCILAELRRRGLDPLQLPPAPRGKRGVKAEVREALVQQEAFSSNAVFDKIWQSLLKDGLISNT